jgi:lipopolysaccharide transport system ATP-binding protein
MVDIWKGLFNNRKTDYELLRNGEFWALDKVHANLPKGESLGVLGRNGSGKSTLLKILNGNLMPTSGEVSIQGSVRLLALGAGFNPTLSGADNIRIACSLIGHSSRDTRRLFDEIVDFSELGEFIDSPVKTYSSGMYARLGFSVSVMTNPDLLLIDEALAVGDLPFVSKCLRKIHEYRSRGGSMVIVSHSGYTIRQNCTKAIWLDKGKLRMSGDANEVCTEYEMYLASETNNTSGMNLSEAQFHHDIENFVARCPESIYSGDGCEISIEFESKTEIKMGAVSITVIDANNTNVFFCLPDPIKDPVGINRGYNKWTFSYEHLPLMRGMYRINVVIYDGKYENQYATILGATNFEVRLKASYPTAGILLMNPKIQKKHEN